MLSVDEWCEKGRGIQTEVNRVCGLVLAVEQKKVVSKIGLVDHRGVYALPSAMEHLRP